MYMKMVHQRDRERWHGTGQCSWFVVLWVLTLSLSPVTSTAATASLKVFDCGPCECSNFEGEFEGALSVDCKNRGLTEVPSFLENSNFTNNVSRVYLNNNNITRIEDETFQALRNLRSISLSSNKINYIGRNVFRRELSRFVLNLDRNELHNDSFHELALEKVQMDYLDLSYNQLPEPPKILAKATAVWILIIHHNPMYILREDAFSGFSRQLQLIDLSDCRLQEIEFHTFYVKNFFDLQNLYLDNNNFTTIKEYYFKEVHVADKLTIINSNVRTIEKHAFKDFPHLKYLFMDDNNLGDGIHKKAFADLDVTILQLKRCNITSLKNNFMNPKSIIILDLSENNIEEIKAGAFRKMNRLRKLILSGNNIQKIEGQPFNNLNDLQELYLDRNKLNESAQHFLDTNPDLHTLDISQNRFKSMPNISGLPNLIDLYAFDNKIKCIYSDDFKNTSITNLRLSSNFELHYFSKDALSCLTELTSLDLSWTSLTTLPSLHGLEKLVNLDVVHSNIAELPSDLCEHSPRLVELLANNNNLTKVPDLQKCSRLSVVFLDNNNIQEIGEKTFSGLKSLTTVLIHNNKIEWVHPKAFAGLSRLALLHLSHNYITTIHPNMFDGLNELEKLELQYNRITSLPNKIFKDLAGLQSLSFHNNRIRSVGETIFATNMTWLTYLDISDNPDMDWFPIPQSGFPFLHTLRMSNLPLILNVPSITEIPRIQFLYLTYSYHCCIFKDHLPSDILITPKKSSSPEVVDSSFNHDEVIDIELHGNGTHIDLTDEHEADETILIIIRPSQEPLTLPPHVLEGHSFPDYQDPYNPKDHNIPREEIVEIIEKLAQQGNLSIRISANNEIDIVERDENGTFTVYGGVDEDNIKQIFSKLQIFNNISQVYCEPPPNAFMPCESLLDPDPVRVLVWIIWFPAILGNIAVIFVSLASTEKVDVPSFILCNLALADFMLGVFLSFLGVVDVRTFGDKSFYKSALHWQKGPGCKTAGFIGVFSTELSIYLMVILTLERLHTIVYSFKQQGSRMKMRHAVVLVGIGWVVAGIAALLPLFGVNSYTEVAMCLPFKTNHIADKVYLGLLFSLSLIAFLIILFSYVHILVIYCKSPATERRLQERIVISLKMGVLVLVNTLCWMPLAVLGLAALAEIYLINLTYAKFFIVLVLPLNACFNPFLYTIFTKAFWEKCMSLCKKTDQKFHDVTASRRRNSLASATSTISSDRDIDFDLLQRRQSRRSLSLQVEPQSSSMTSPIQTVSPGPQMGRRYSSPAIFGVDTGSFPCRKVGTRMPSDPTLMDQNDPFIVSMRLQQGDFNRTGSTCLSVVQEETSVCSSEDEEDSDTKNPQSPLRFSKELMALQRNGPSSAAHQKHDVKSYVRRGIHPMCNSDTNKTMVDNDDDADNRSECSSSSEYDDARSSPLPVFTMATMKNYTVNTRDRDTPSSDELNRYSASTTDSYSVYSRKTHHNVITRIINPHTNKPVLGTMESTC